MNKHNQLHICLNRDGRIKDPNFSRVIFALRNGNKARLSRSGHVFFNSNVRNLIYHKSAKWFMPVWSGLDYYSWLFLKVNPYVTKRNYLPQGRQFDYCQYNKNIEFKIYFFLSFFLSFFLFLNAESFLVQAVSISYLIVHVYGNSP